MTNTMVAARYANNWYETGRASFKLGLPCDERYPLEYIEGYAGAASIVGIKCKRVILDSFAEWWRANYSVHDFTQSFFAESHSEGRARAKLVNLVVAVRKANREVHPIVVPISNEVENFILSSPRGLL
jgi:hypothetical protein